MSDKDYTGFQLSLFTLLLLFILTNYFVYKNVTDHIDDGGDGAFLFSQRKEFRPQGIGWPIMFDIHNWISQNGSSVPKKSGGRDIIAMVMDIAFAICVLAAVGALCEYLVRLRDGHKL